MTQFPHAVWQSSADGALRVARAQELLELVDGDSAVARDAALALLAADESDEAAVVSLRVLGLSYRFTDNTQATEVLRRSVALASRLSLPVRAAQARTSLIVLLAHQGRTAEALREAAKAKAEASRK